MLAERKKRVKWSLNPRGNFWSQGTPHAFFYMALSFNAQHTHIQRLMNTMTWNITLNFMLRVTQFDCIAPRI